MKVIALKVVTWMVAVAFASVAAEVVAQSESRGSAAPPVARENPQAFVIAHRLIDWETRHFDDATKAQQHMDVLHKLGVEVRVEQHQGHSDVIYRSVNWKPWQVGSDELAHQWEDWLRDSGFQTLHGHHPSHDQHAHHADHGHAAGKGHAEEHAEVVLYRLPAGGTQRFENLAGAEEFITLLQALRCEVRKGGQEGPTDVQFRCAEWTAVEFTDHDSATSWEKWLTSAGFEVEHNHDEHSHDGQGPAGNEHAGHSHP